MAGSKPGERRGGRQKGTPNKTTAKVRDVITETLERLGGTDGLLEWANSSAENKMLFYTRIMPRLVGTGREDDGPTVQAHYIIGDKPMSVEEWAKKFVRED